MNKGKGIKDIVFEDIKIFIVGKNYTIVLTIPE